MGNYLNTKNQNYTDLNNYKNQTLWLDYPKLFKCRIPYLIEEKLGINMQYLISSWVPNSLLTTPLRHAVKEDDLAAVKHAIFTGAAKLDDPVD